MPELPELEVVREVLNRRVVGQTITEVGLVMPGAAIVTRDLSGRGFAAGIAGRTVEAVARRGKFLIFTLAGQEPVLFLAINPKLAGRLQLADAKAKKRGKTHVIFSLSGGGQLRYFDQKQMGQLYLTANLDLVPDFAGLGPEALEISLEEFKGRLKPFRGEIKGVLTRGEFVAGIGNAYADEILWEARIHPYKKRTQLSAEEVERLFGAMRGVLLRAIEQVRAGMGENIEQEPREFMAVHMKTGQPCPRCGTPVSMVSANQRVTNFCRECQPGGLIKGM